ncbi:uncharacterized protein N7518_007480 [Penicillium psychrosexuale]|uniref:uncharacterized protein n=1 Tax=Penicillium psychrosexuale TaxID=1002107 RepID=UPI002544F56C|nr:uncharacterized protein N7518_007480 [Penicillium psychrosexuale]KAJ5790469.1 hypothetical protein N7518_007480 [Penicillium psychrosexuale]
MRHPRVLILLLAGVASLVAGGDDHNYFTNPASNTGVNPVFTLGDKLVVSWKTTLEVFNVSIWQQSLVETGAASQGNIFSKIHSTDYVTNFTWVVQVYGFDLSYSNVFFLWINPDEKGGFVSTYFNVTEPVATTSTTTSSTTSTSTSASTSASTNTPHTTIKLSSSPSSSSLSSLSISTSDQTSQLAMTEKIAIGIGIGVGVPILCILGALLYLKIRNSNDKTISPETIHPWMVHNVPPSPPKEVHGGSLTPHLAELPHRPYR